MKSKPSTHSLGRAVRLAATLGALAAGAAGQTSINLRSQSREVDFSGATNTRVNKTGTVLPPVCQVGETYFKTDAPAGQHLYGCSATNIWSLLSGGSSPDAVTAPAAFGNGNRLLRSNGAGRAAQTGACLLDDNGNLQCPGSLSAGDGASTGYLEALAGPAPGDPAGSQMRLYFDSANANRLSDRDSAGVARIYLSDPGNAGLTARTAAGVLSARSLNGTAGEIVVSNGDGVAGSPSIALASSLDFSAKTSTKPSKAGTTPPASCGVGETFIDTGAAAQSQWLICGPANTWTAQGAPSSGGGSSPDAVTAPVAFDNDNRLLRSDGVARAAQTGACLLDDDGNLQCPGSLGAGDGVSTGYLQALVGPAPADPPPSQLRLYFDGANANRLSDRDSAGVARIYLSDPGNAGLTARTAAGVLSARSLTGTAGEILVTNGDGVAGSPSIALATSLDFSAKTATKPSKAGATPPASCGVGETFIDTDALSQSQWLICGPANTWTAQGAPSLNPTGVLEWDDFLPGSSTSGQLGKLGWVAEGTVTDNDSSNLFTNTNLPGTLLMRSTGSWSDVRLAVNKYGPLLPTAGAQIFESQFIVYPRTLTQTHLRVGWNRQDFGSSADYQDTSLSLIFRDGADTNWMFQACHAATCVTVNSGVTPAADTVYRLRIRTLTAGVFRYALSTAGGAFSPEKTICAAGCDGALSAIADSAGYLSPYFAIKSLDTSAKEALVDYFAYSIPTLAR